jgi:hypothetical protein
MSDATYNGPTSTAVGIGSGSPPGSTFNTGSLLGLGALGIGAAGLGTILAEGPTPLPSEFSSLTNTNVPWLQAGAESLFNTGQGFTQQGQQALEMAQQGQLTPEQQAQLDQERQKLQNTANQEYASMGRNPNQDTSFISTQGNIETTVNAMAQQQIQSTIALGLGETSAGASFSGQALGYENAANSALIAAGTEQLKSDQAYSQSLTSAFSSIGQIFGSVAKAFI